MYYSHCYRFSVVRLVDLDGIAKVLADYLTREDIISLVGALGSGKTTFAKVLFRRLGVEELVDSPSFLLVKSYVGFDKMKIAHIDGYRLSKKVEREIDEYLDSHLCFIEWAGEIGNEIEASYQIDLEYLDLKTRMLEVATTHLIGEWRRHEIHSYN
jgi:tRNA threonylcarbamoyladenosine biosynthesis protein TsaE